MIDTAYKTRDESLLVPIRDYIGSSNNTAEVKQFSKAPPFLDKKDRQYCLEAKSSKFVVV